MPELPEVETLARDLAPTIKGQIITNCWTSDLKMRSQLTKIDRQQIPGKKVCDVSRVGKYLVIELVDRYLLIHFGMSGRLIFAKDQLEKQTILHSLRHIHLNLSFDNFFVLLYDPRRFGKVLTVSKTVAYTMESVANLLNLGLEPLSEQFNTSEFFKMTRGAKRNIKSFLMDGRKIAGVGNIYATEALFRAGIRPSLPCSKISAARCSQLVACLKLVLSTAIKKGGSSLRDFSGLKGERGAFVDEHLAYGKKKFCIVCKKELLRKVISQRTTSFCSRCQQ